LWGGSEFIETENASSRLLEIATRIDDAHSKPDQIASLKEALSAAYQFLGSPDESLRFDENSAILANILSGLKEKIKAAEKALNAPLIAATPAEAARAGITGNAADILAARKTILHHQSAFEKNPDFYEQEMRALDLELAENENLPVLRHNLLVTHLDDAIKRLPESEWSEAYMKRYPQAAHFQHIIFELGLTDLGALQQKIGTDYQGILDPQFVFIGTADSGVSIGSAVDNLNAGEIVRVIQLHKKATSARGLVRIAGRKILSPFTEFEIPGLVRVASGVYVWLPQIRPYELLRLLREANDRIRSVGASA
jgi:hypothetical protein